MQLALEETARNEVDATLMKTTEQLKEANMKYETDITERDSEIIKLKDEVRPLFTVHVCVCTCVPYKYEVLWGILSFQDFVCDFLPTKINTFIVQHSTCT